MDERVLARLHYQRLPELSKMALSELSERCYRTIGHYLSTIGVHYRTIGPGLRLLQSRLGRRPVPKILIGRLTRPTAAKHLFFTETEPENSKCCQFPPKFHQIQKWPFNPSKIHFRDGRFTYWRIGRRRSKILSWHRHATRNIRCWGRSIIHNYSHCYLLESWPPIININCYESCESIILEGLSPGSWMRLMLSIIHYFINICVPAKHGIEYMYSIYTAILIPDYTCVNCNASLINIYTCVNWFWITHMCKAHLHMCNGLHKTTLCYIVCNTCGKLV